MPLESFAMSCVSYDSMRFLQGAYKPALPIAIPTMAAGDFVNAPEDAIDIEGLSIAVIMDVGHSPVSLEMYRLERVVGMLLLVEAPDIVVLDCR